MSPAAIKIKDRQILEGGYGLHEPSSDTLLDTIANYTTLFDNTGTAILLIGNDMTILKGNRKAVELFGYDLEEIEGVAKWTRFVHSDDLEKMKAYHRNRRNGMGTAPNVYESRVVQKSGEVRHVVINVDVIPGTSKSVASFIDITPLKKTEQMLEESKEHLQRILDLVDGYIYTCTREYRITYMNRKLIERTGFDATGGWCYQVLHDLEAPCPWCVNDRVFSGESVKWEIQSPKDQRWYYCINTPEFQGGHVIRKQVVVVDITDRKLKELALVEQQTELSRENRRLRASVKDRYRYGDIIGKCPAMQDVYESIERAAGTSDGVVIYGESGTGKELVARAIHEVSARHSASFIPVNCGAIPENLLESEFFGHQKGAFTGADTDKKGFIQAAEGGSLFLDEIGELTPALQVKLLRAVEGGYAPVGGQVIRTTDVRIIAATNRDLSRMVEEGNMRQDFYYRIHILPIYLPPLRERKEDIPMLIQHFLEIMNVDMKYRFTGDVIDRLIEYDWPGNIRELKNAIRRYLTLGELSLGQSARNRQMEPVSKAKPPVLHSGVSLKDAMEDFEKQMILDALAQCRWHRSRAAESLGINRRTLFKKMKMYGIE